jgi:hypothetical protein
MSNGQRFLVRRDDLTQTRIEPFDAAAGPLAAGAVRFRIDHFGFSANNITYAVFGESMDYWRFFPATQGWGCIPVWGFAEVEASNCDALASGQRCYGYWPMATHAVVEPVEVGAHGFVDGSAHRANLPPIYNRYQRTAAGQDLQREGEIALLRPLFATAWLITEFLREAGHFGARTLLLSSASSKTALATAFCLGQLAGPAAPRLAGATSPSRLGFVSGLHIYDEVIAYDALATLSAAEPALYIDFSGDAPFRRAVHEHWRDHLVYSCAVGATHHEATGGASGLPGPKPQFFFAPEQLRQRSAPPPQGLGRAALMQQIDAAWAAFIARAAEGAAPWLTLQMRRGAEAMQATYRDTLRGRCDPGVGLLLAF